MIIPSIDLMNGRAVRLRQGKEVVFVSDRNPVDIAKEYNRYGPVAVIDLDAALGRGDNRALIARMCRVAEVRVGGGIRDDEQARFYLRSGAKKIIIGTAACDHNSFIKKILPERIIIALDHKDFRVVDEGWTRETGESIEERARATVEFCSEYLCTFVDRDGTGDGIPVAGVQKIAGLLKRPMIIAGGIQDTFEVIQFSRMGFDVQVGLGIYSKDVDLANSVIGSLSFSEDGLIPTIVRDISGQVLMHVYSSHESLRRLLREGKGIYYSRSRKEIWEKGATSGNTEIVISCRTDCDRDALLVTVEQTGVACHTNNYSCFRGQPFAMHALFKILEDRLKHASDRSYSGRLFKDLALLREKILEEAQEVVDANSFEGLRWEVADVVYHMAVLLMREGITWQDIENELAGRQRI